MTNLGALLVEREVATSDRSRRRSRRQALQGGDLATSLLELGLASEGALRTPSRNGTVFIPRRRRAPAASPRILRLVPGEVALRHLLYPLERTRGSLRVAFSSPFPRATREDLSSRSASARTVRRDRFRVRSSDRAGLRPSTRSQTLPPGRDLRKKESASGGSYVAEFARAARHCAGRRVREACPPTCSPPSRGRREAVLSDNPERRMHPSAEGTPHAPVDVSDKGRKNGCSGHGYGSRRSGRDRSPRPRACCAATSSATSGGVPAETAAVPPPCRLVPRRTSPGSGSGGRNFGKRSRQEHAPMAETADMRPAAE